MGSNQFQREYIEYLQERNTELLSRLSHMKENYENKILSKDINKHYLISTLEDMLNICTVIPQEIDLFFDKMTAAMGAFKNILLRKSEMVQLVEKITKAINPENLNNDLFTMGNSGLMKEQTSEGRVGKKAGTVKVSPMINGHIISTEPRIYLSRVPGVFTPGTRNEEHQLSPIIEASPDTSSEPSNFQGGHIFREIKIPLERINLSKMSYNYINEVKRENNSKMIPLSNEEKKEITMKKESPKSRFKGPKTWKKSLSSNKHQLDNNKNTVFLDNNEVLNKKLAVGEIGNIENTDPLEGPSWLYEENSEMNSSPSRFIDFRRRKHRFATVFDKNEDCITYVEKKSLDKSANEFYENQKETDDEKEDFEDIKKRVSESMLGSEDYIRDSFPSECDENYSPFKKKCRSSKRWANEISTDKKDFPECKDFKKETSTSFLKNKKSSANTSVCSGSSDEGNSEEISVQKFSKVKKSDKKRPVESSVGKIPVMPCFNSTPNKADELGEKDKIRKRNNDLKSKSLLIKAALESDVYVKLEDCLASRETLPKNSKTRSSVERNKFKKSKSRSKSRSPVVILSENEGRKKRKAAPSFKLVEPKLKTKLRRS